jgi:putative nucleotidyltransferase with HDIG domain
LQRTRKAMLITDLAAGTHYTDAQREILRAAGVKAAIVVPMMWQDEIIGILSVASQREGVLGARDVQFLTAVASQVTAIVQMETLVGDLQSATLHLQDARADTVVLLAAAAEAHDQTTGRHLQRVRMISEALARELGYDDENVDAVGLAATLHDIGKMRVPDTILLSPGQLGDEEWATMKQHTLWGAEFLGNRPGFELATAIAAAHHERWDGTGYPRGLRREAIPEVATIVAVADSLDAITNDRPYRIGRSVEWAVQEIIACSGRQFSPRVVDALVRLHERGALLFGHEDEELGHAA